MIARARLSRLFRAWWDRQTAVWTRTTLWQWELAREAEKGAWKLLEDEARKIDHSLPRERKNRERAA